MSPRSNSASKTGKINPDLTIGVDVRSVEQLTANDGISPRGVKLHGAGFIVTPAEAERSALASGRT